jgi:hypothetical protein
LDTRIQHSMLQNYLYGAVEDWAVNTAAKLVLASAYAETEEYLLTDDDLVAALGESFMGAAIFADLCDIMQIPRSPLIEAALASTTCSPWAKRGEPRRG